MTWERFAAIDAIGLSDQDAARLLGRTSRDIERARRGIPRGTRGASTDYGALFARWHGRPPTDDEWPAPRRSPTGRYPWLAPELAQLALLVGRFDAKTIAEILTQRLRKVTGDKAATRSELSVRNHIARIGLHLGDIVGGLTVQAAGEQIGSELTVRRAIKAGDLKTLPRVGLRIVIDPDSWKRWLEGRVYAPKHYVRLATLREPLGISSDSKLPEFAAEGLIPTAIRCTPPTAGHGTTRFGTWYIDPKVAKQLIADRRAGRPMPWHGVPLRSNVRHTYRLWCKRRHPPSCKTCQTIWGAAGAPDTFEAFLARYATLAHGAKRHLTLAHSPGLSMAAVARQAKVSVARVRRAIDAGMLETQADDGRVTRTEATRWIARRCPDGGGRTSWITLAQAKAMYRLSGVQIRARIATGEMKVKMLSKDGRARLHVARQQCAAWREAQGYTDTEAARLVGVSVAKLRTLLDGVNWRGTGAIPAVTVNAVIKRFQSQAGMTLPEAAKALRRPEAWIRARIHEGVVKVKKAPWDARRQYLSMPMVERLRTWKPARRPRAVPLGPQWLDLAAASALAGVSIAAVNGWAKHGQIDVRLNEHGIRRFRRASVKARARKLWEARPGRRQGPPAWLAAQLRKRAA